MDDGATANPFTLRYLLVGGFLYESNAHCWHRLGRGVGHRVDGRCLPDVSPEDVLCARGDMPACHVPSDDDVPSEDDVPSVDDVPSADHVRAQDL